MKALLLFLILFSPCRSFSADSTDKDLGKDLKFEGEVLEGMNKIPTRSVENIEHSDKKNKNHLYTKRPHFRDEMKRLVQEMRIAP